ncbi:Alpha/Beta hydrolase protein [Xylaria grammica]|nr:Alpha/Beta hydrolase protein [Xylaria grammica]
MSWAQGNEGDKLGIDQGCVLGGGDSAGGNMTATSSLRISDKHRKGVASTFRGNISNGIFHSRIYLPRLPDTASVQNLRGLPPATVFTCGFDPLRDVGVEYASKLQKDGNEVLWRHYGDLTHGFLQMAPWSEDAMKAMKDVALLVKKFTN